MSRVTAKHLQEKPFGEDLMLHSDGDVDRSERRSFPSWNAIRAI